jgi:hypothetical protein
LPLAGEGDDECPHTGTIYKLLDDKVIVEGK